MSTKRTYQPKKSKKRTLGFRNKSKKVIKKRRQKGRKKLSY